MQLTDRDRLVAGRAQAVPQEGTLPSYGMPLSQKRMSWTWRPVAKLARDGTQIGELQ